MTEDVGSKAEPVKRNPQESRTGEIGQDEAVRGPVRYVLIVSTLLAILALVIAFFVSR